MIEVKHLTKYYADRCAVEDLNFSVQKGQIVGLLGVNGAGKSTTMNMLTGYLAPDEGQILIEGFDIIENPLQARRQIGYLPEIPPLYQDMKVKEYLMFIAQLRKLGKAEQATEVQAAAKQAGVDNVMHRLIRNLSKGYRQRVGLAAALVGHPPFLILDEPTVGLDPKQMIEMRTLIRELGKEHTVLFSSHILSEVSAVCDHILILSNGKLAAQGTPEELQQQMQGKSRLSVTVLGNAQKAEQTIWEIPQIEQVSLCETKKDCAAFVVEMPTDVGLKAQLCSKLVYADCPVVNMQETKLSLEEIFLELTEQPQSVFAIQEEEPQHEQTQQDGKQEENNEGDL